MANKNKTVHVFVTPKMRAELKRVAELQDSPVSAIIRRAIAAYLQNQAYRDVVLNNTEEVA